MYASLTIIKMIKSMRMDRACSTWKTWEIHTEVWLGKSEGKRPLWRHKLRWEGNIRRNLREVGWVGVDWMHLAQDRNQWQALMNMVMDLWVP